MAGNQRQLAYGIVSQDVSELATPHDAEGGIEDNPYTARRALLVARALIAASTRNFESLSAGVDSSNPLALRVRHPRKPTRRIELRVVSPRHESDEELVQVKRYVHDLLFHEDNRPTGKDRVHQLLQMAIKPGADCDKRILQLLDDPEEYTTASNDPSPEQERVVEAYLEDKQKEILSIDPAALPLPNGLYGPTRPVTGSNQLSVRSTKLTPRFLMALGQTNDTTTTSAIGDDHRAVVRVMFKRCGREWTQASIECRRSQTDVTALELTFCAEYKYSSPPLAENTTLYVKIGDTSIINDLFEPPNTPTAQRAKDIEQWIDLQSPSFSQDHELKRKSWQPWRFRLFTLPKYGSETYARFLASHIRAHVLANALRRLRRVGDSSADGKGSKRQRLDDEAEEGDDERTPDPSEDGSDVEDLGSEGGSQDEADKEEEEDDDEDDEYDPENPPEDLQDDEEEDEGEDDDEVEDGDEDEDEDEKHGQGEAGQSNEYGVGQPDDELNDDQSEERDGEPTNGLLKTPRRLQPRKRRRAASTPQTDRTPKQSDPPVVQASKEASDPHKCMPCDSPVEWGPTAAIEPATLLLFGESDTYRGSAARLQARFHSTFIGCVCALFRADANGSDDDCTADDCDALPADLSDPATSGFELYCCGQQLRECPVTHQWRCPRHHARDTIAIGDAKTPRCGHQIWGRLVCRHGKSLRVNHQILLSDVEVQMACVLFDYAFSARMNLVDQVLDQCGQPIALSDAEDHTRMQVLKRLTRLHTKLDDQLSSIWRTRSSLLKSLYQTNLLTQFDAYAASQLAIRDEKMKFVYMPKIDWTSESKRWGSPTDPKGSWRTGWLQWSHLSNACLRKGKALARQRTKLGAWKRMPTGQVIQEIKPNEGERPLTERDVFELCYARLLPHCDAKLK